MATSVAAYLKPLRKDDYLVISLGDSVGSVPFVVRRATAFPLVYDPVKQGVFSGMMAPVGAAPSGSQVASFVDNVLLALSSAVTSIAGVTDVFQLLKQYEILQAWFGVAPRQLRVWAKQPYGQFVGVMDGSMNPSSTYPDVGFVHGYDSPFGRPAKETELTILRNTSVNWAFQNPGPWPINPRLWFFINRMFVEPVKDPALALSLVSRRIPAHHTSIGNPENTVTFDSPSYGQIKPIPTSILTEDSVTQKASLAKRGYC
jgi:hypothetical protein